MIAFIDQHKKRETEGLPWGVEPICAQLPIAPQTYYAFKSRPVSARSLRDEYLKGEIGRVFEANYRVYGAEKIWWQLNREGIGVARCTVERLMKELGIRGAVRGKKLFTTVSDQTQPRPADMVNRDFTAEAPNRRWVADFLRADPVGILLCRIGDRLLRPDDRRLEPVPADDHRSGSHRLGAGDLDSAPER